jgi:hypothetical protein
MKTQQIPVKPAWVKFDKYPWRFFSEYELSANERLIIFCLALEMTWEDRTWTGSVVDLTNHTKISRVVAKKIVDRFVDIGLLTCIKPFSSNSVGFYEVNFHDRLIIPELPKTGRPVGARDAYQRTRTSTKGNENVSQSEPKRNTNDNKVQEISHLKTVNTLIGNEKSYKSPREAERRVVERESESSYLAENNDEVPEVLRSLDASPIQSGDNPCGICGDEKGPHIWATSDGSGHEWVPAKVTKFTDEELFEGM